MKILCKSDRTNTVPAHNTVACLRVQTFKRSNRIQYILASSPARQFPTLIHVENFLSLLASVAQHSQLWLVFFLI
jgi:hypothetical protein